MQRTKRFVRTVQGSLRRIALLGFAPVKRMLVIVTVVTTGVFFGSVAGAQPLPLGAPVLPDLSQIQLPSLQGPALPQVELPGSIGELIDQIVPEPNLPESTATPDGVAVPPEEAKDFDVEALSAAIQPSPAGDPFVDTRPANLAELPLGFVIKSRDVTATAGWMVGGRSIVKQTQYRTTDGNGRPSVGVMTYAVPDGWVAGDGVVINNLPIDSLGARCTPSWTMSKGLGIESNITDFIPPITTASTVLGKYAVLIVDHQGAQQVYADGPTAAYTILDGVRALRNFDDRFSTSKYVMTGYSGGAIATDAAARFIKPYAPELQEFIVGAAPGGTPIDKQVLSKTMTGELNWAKGIFIFAVYAIARKHPELLPMVNNLAAHALPYMKDLCIIPMALMGLLPLPVDVLSTVPDPLNSDLAREMYAKLDISDMPYGTPMFVYNGEQEFWIVPEMALQLYREQCSFGVPSILRLVPGEHAIAAVTALPDLVTWIDGRLQGQPVPNEC